MIVLLEDSVRLRVGLTVSMGGIEVAIVGAGSVDLIDFVQVD